MDTTIESKHSGKRISAGIGEFEVDEKDELLNFLNQCEHGFMLTALDENLKPKQSSPFIYRDNNCAAITNKQLISELIKFLR